MTALDSSEVGKRLAEIATDKFVTSKASALAELGVEASDAPTWLVKPGSAAEISEIARLANVNGIALIPVGNRARAPYVKLGSRARILVDSRRMDHVLHLDETSLMVHVQAGLTAVALEKILQPRGLSLGDYPPTALGSTIGGLLSVRTPGKASARHGFIEDAVLGVSAVLADGRTIHTRVAPRRSTGPDLARSMCGSEGTLGYITSVVLRIHRRPEARFLAAYRLPNFSAALAAVRLALREEAVPAALRVYDSNEAIMHLGDGACEPGEAVLVAATAGPTDLAACDRDLLASATTAESGSALDTRLAELWWRRRTGQDTGDAPPLPSVQVTASLIKLKHVYAAVVEALADDGVTARAHASRFDAVGGVMFFSFNDSTSGAALAPDRLESVRSRAQDVARDAGAFLLGMSNPALSPYLESFRAALDPNGIMNPGALGGR
jgi:alkyldihydroxyacetonephosphate synthase